MTDQIVFIVAAFLSSIISGMIGMAGGIILLAFMAPIFPPTVLIPLHGTVQFFSNFARVALSPRDVNWRITGIYTLGAALGAFAASHFILNIPQNTFQIIIAIAILIMTWKPKIKNFPRIKGQFFFVGAIASFLSLFVGAIGPFIAPFFLHVGLKKNNIVATKASCQFPTHAFKVVAYVLTGFLIGPWIKILAIVVPLVFLGNWIGKQLLGRIPEKSFRLIFKIVITILVVRMLSQVSLA